MFVIQISASSWLDLLPLHVLTVNAVLFIYVMLRQLFWRWNGRDWYPFHPQVLPYLGGQLVCLHICGFCVCMCKHTHIQGLSKRFEHLLWPPRSPYLTPCDFFLRSPDLTPCDFFLWGYIKDNAYKPQTARSHSSCGANHWRGTR